MGTVKVLSIKTFNFIYVHQVHQPHPPRGPPSTRAPHRPPHTTLQTASQSLAPAAPAPLTLTLPRSTVNMCLWCVCKGGLRATWTWLSGVGRRCSGRSGLGGHLGSWRCPSVQCFPSLRFVRRLLLGSGGGIVDTLKIREPGSTELAASAQ